MRLRLYFLAFGFVGLAALLAQFISSPDLIAYLSFFTILSNIAVASLFLCLGFTGKDFEKSNFLFGALTTYILVSSVGYWLFLRDQPVPILWINTVLHIVMPCAALLGWIIHKQKPLKYKVVLTWLIFPILYLAYTLVRGALTNWYPYLFLNPQEMGGYGGVFIYIAILSTIIYLLGIATVFIGNKLHK